MSDEAKVAFLRRPEAHPEQPESVEVVETHMSWVFLIERDVYELRKPVRWDRLDFSTPALRKRDCEEEVRLNRRLARGVYLGTTELTFEPAAGLALGGAGEPVDWLVYVRRLPAERMLDALILRGPLDEAEVRRRRSAELRILDPADELAFLLLECERLGSARAGRFFLDAYREVSGDEPPEPLLRFHRTRCAPPSRRVLLERWGAAGAKAHQRLLLEARCAPYWGNEARKPRTARVSPERSASRWDALPRPPLGGRAPRRALRGTRVAAHARQEARWRSTG